MTAFFFLILFYFYLFYLPPPLPPAPSRFLSLTFPFPPVRRPFSPPLFIRGAFVLYLYFCRARDVFSEGEAKRHAGAAAELTADGNARGGKGGAFETEKPEGWPACRTNVWFYEYTCGTEYGWRGRSSDGGCVCRAACGSALHEGKPAKHPSHLARPIAGKPRRAVTRIQLQLPFLFPPRVRRWWMFFFFFFVNDRAPLFDFNPYRVASRYSPFWHPIRTLGKRGMNKKKSEKEVKRRRNARAFYRREFIPRS